MNTLTFNRNCPSTIIEVRKLIDDLTEAADMLIVADADEDTETVESAIKTTSAPKAVKQQPRIGDLSRFIISVTPSKSLGNSPSKFIAVDQGFRFVEQNPQSLDKFFISLNENVPVQRVTKSAPPFLPIPQQVNADSDRYLPNTSQQSKLLPVKEQSRTHTDSDLGRFHISVPSSSSQERAQTRGSELQPSNILNLGRFVISVPESTSINEDLPKANQAQSGLDRFKISVQPSSLQIQPKSIDNSNVGRFDISVAESIPGGEAQPGTPQNLDLGRFKISVPPTESQIGSSPNLGKVGISVEASRPQIADIQDKSKGFDISVEPSGSRSPKVFITGEDDGQEILLKQQNPTFIPFVQSPFVPVSPSHSVNVNTFQPVNVPPVHKQTLKPFVQRLVWSPLPAPRVPKKFLPVKKVVRVKKQRKQAFKPFVHS